MEQIGSWREELYRCGETEGPIFFIYLFLFFLVLRFWTINEIRMYIHSLCKNECECLLKLAFNALCSEVDVGLSLRVPIYPFIYLFIVIMKLYNPQIE